ncbi:MAG TPA: NHL repeat-containing protein [Pirellulales bacterium]|nr:NHL repeat-containing protein [Pirellulales bacterium]
MQLTVDRDLDASMRTANALPRRNSAGLRRSLIVCCALVASVLGGCDEDRASIGKLDKVWGRKGISDGRLQKPRAVAIDAADQLYIVDMTARIQVFSPDGEFLRFWRTPVHTNGRPTGLSFDRHGRLLVADTHYFRVLVYSTEGELLSTLGGVQGHGPGEFGFVTDAVEDSHGFLYVSEYGEYDRIQKFTSDGQFVLEWGGHGFEPGKFVRPQNMAIDEQDRIWVTDACNHRIQVFDAEGKLLDVWGTQGSEPGQLYYPYDLAFDDAGDLYVCEYGNHRVQKFTRQGESLGCWGRHGRAEGELHHPWGLVRDKQGRIHVLDSLNHRVQRIVM